MNIDLTVSIVALIIGIAALVLFFVNRAHRRRTGLLVLALLMFGVSIAIYLAGVVGRPGDAFSETPVAIASPATHVASAPTSTREVRQSPTRLISPISPVSPVVIPESKTTEVVNTYEDFEGCLLFVSNRTGDFEIYKLRDDFDDLQQLTVSPGLDIDPDWSPDGRNIAFASDREEGAGFQIYVMNADGSDEKRLGEVQPGENSHPSWSPDGSQIAFQSRRDTNRNPQDDNFDIYVMNSDGSDIRPLTTHSADDSEPGWSPDSRKIAFLSERSGQDEIYLMDTDGSNPEQMTDLAVLKSGLSWSSDSQSIVFEGNGDLYIVDVETKDVSKLISDNSANEATPAWAENDTSIVFSSDRTQNWELYVVDIGDANGFTLQQITDNPGIDRSPKWFPCTQ